MTPNGSDNFEDRHRDDGEEMHMEDRENRRSMRSSRSRSPHRSRSPRERSRDEETNSGNSLFVTGLSVRTSDRDLDEFFSKYGKVIKTQIMYDPHTRESRGFGFVAMETSEEADSAKEAVNGREFQEPRRVDRFDPRYDYTRSYDRYDRPPRNYGREPYYDRGYDRSYYDRGYERGGGYERNYDRAYERGYDRDRRPQPPARYDPYQRPRSPY
nr:7335_t:CDS:2 [Entrophospora candida]